TFPDKTSAEYELEIVGGVRIWTWNGHAWNAQHQPIHKDGTVISPPATSSTSGGSVNMSASSPTSSTYNITVIGGPTYQASVTVEAIPEAESVTTSTDAY